MLVRGARPRNSIRHYASSVYLAPRMNRVEGPSLARQSLEKVVEIQVIARWIYDLASCERYKYETRKLVRVRYQINVKTIVVRTNVNDYELKCRTWSKMEVPIGLTSGTCKQNIPRKQCGQMLLRNWLEIYFYNQKKATWPDTPREAWALEQRCLTIDWQIESGSDRGVPAISFDD